MVNWLEERCPVCGIPFKYPEGGYKPKTCATFDCTQKYHRHPEKYISFMEFVDECRRDANL